MKVLILGGSGMVGHALIKNLSVKYEVFSILRQRKDLESTKFFKKILEKNKCIFLDDINQHKKLDEVVKKISPDILINCIGVIKQRGDVNNILNMIKINALLPHILNEICFKNKVKLIHLSTDCVFSGKKGYYKESDNPDPVDKYGASKLLGEIVEGDALTIRTSFIGPELFNKKSLFEWIKSQKDGEIDGFDKAIYSGLTTYAFAKVIEQIIDKHLQLNGIWQVSSDPISKFDLIVLINLIFKLNIKINRNSSFECDRSLNSSAFKNKTNILIPSWKEMINNLYEGKNEVVKK
jgi:dTDP-4-dehydrorhamnose reductase